VAERCEKGLCFNRDQKWSRQHNFCGRRFLMVTDENDDGPSTQDMEDLAYTHLSSSDELSPST
jgi:hypothetical protein